jgi:hypothetical protein
VIIRIGISHDKNGRLFPFGDKFLTVFELMVVDDEIRKIRAEKFEGENNDLLNGEDNKFNIDDDRDDED